VAHLLSAPQSRLDALALAFVGLRLGHAAFYLADLGVMRSLAFAGGVACTMAIFLSAL
jgi:uncharacterized MAPEG superfamily protein